MAFSGPSRGTGRQPAPVQNPAPAGKGDLGIIILFYGLAVSQTPSENATGILPTVRGCLHTSRLPQTSLST